MEWVTLEQAKLALSITDTIDDEWLQLCIDGVNQLITDTRSDPDQLNNGRITWGGVQLVTRWYARRNSSDISAFVEMGGPPPSIDRDIEVALQIGRYYGPAVA